MVATIPSTEEIPMESKVNTLIDELTVLDKTHFGKDRAKVIRTKVDEATVLLDQKPIDLVQNKKEKAQLLYLRGKTLDFVPENMKQAEEYLSKSLKLMPTKKAAWDALGDVYFKKADYDASKKCFETSLEQDENDTEVLRNLSIVCRRCPTNDSEQRRANYQRSIKLATKAISLDMKDSESWYVLGNAHFTNFFTNNESIEQLEKALKAYGQTEKLMKEPNPDLFFNRATILEYLERYNEAIRDYNLAHAIDPNLRAGDKAGQIINYVVQTCTLVQSRSASKAKKNIDLAKSVPTVIDKELSFPSHKQITAPAQYKFATISDLGSNGNDRAILPAKVVMHLQKPSEVPLSFLVVDSNQCFAVVSFYQTGLELRDQVQANDLIYIKNPELVFTSLDFKGRKYHYNCVKVAQMTDVLLNGLPLQESRSEVVYENP